MNLTERISKIPRWQKIRYSLIILSCALFFGPFLVIPRLFNVSDFCGTLCMRRFYLYYPGMELNDVIFHMKVSLAGVFLLFGILIVTFLFGRLWCAFLCPIGGLPELISRLLNDRIKIEYRILPQVAIRYGYFGFYLVMMPMLGISACLLCNFIVLPRIFDAIGGGVIGKAYFFSPIGLVNLALVALLGFFASKGRAYCAFLCPVGAIDGIINRIGAFLGFTRRTRVDMNRCNGCTLCARACMCGAIEMKDDKAVIDQFSCMSCHECVDVCPSGAIEYLVIPPIPKPSRNTGARPLPAIPAWTSTSGSGDAKAFRNINWQQIAFWFVMILMLLFILTTQAYAAARKTDPDGCLSCHALKGLDYIDENGLLRSASIDESHYFSSLHGSVPCRDCHRKIREYPHNPKNGEVNCAESCHINEPSKNEKYTHKDIVKEFEGSVHKGGWTRGFTGGNRLKEIKEEPNPSCRRCHSNTLYIDSKKMPRFQEFFTNCDRECGICHQGEVWRNQYGGHILRRLLGARWDKREKNRLCDNCHGDVEKMSRIERRDQNTGKKKASTRFIMASRTYSMTLHGKLTQAKEELAASCIDCHAPSGYRHGIRSSSNPLSSTNKNHLTKTCSRCHRYAAFPYNTGFVMTDMHSLDLIRMNSTSVSIDNERGISNWFRGAVALILITVILLSASLLWSMFNSRRKRRIRPVIWGDVFERKILKKRRRQSRDNPAVMLCLILVGILFVSADASAGNLYLDEVEKAEVSSKEVIEAKKKMGKLKEVQVIERLPLQPFHKRVSMPRPQKESFCLVCHTPLPHKKEKTTRTFLNMHVNYISCWTCHLKIRDVTFENRWLSYEESQKKAGRKIAPFYRDEPVVFFKDHPYAKEIGEKWRKLSDNEKASLKVRLHKPIKEKGYGCRECHSMGQKLLNLETLGFTPERIKEIKQNRIARFLEEYKKRKRKILLTDLLDLDGKGSVE